MNAEKPVIGITLGDAAGIGPEIVCKVAAADFLGQLATVVILGSESVLLRGMRHTGSSFEYRVIGSVEEARNPGPVALLPSGGLDAEKVEMSKASVQNGKDQGDVLVHCIRLCQAGEMDGFCFAPLNKAALKAGGYNYPSEHEMYADVYGQRENFGEMNYLHGLWNIRVTSHIPFKDICRHITVESILKTARLAFATLNRAGCANPKIAVAALNPHSGENGTCGKEELDIIIPAIELAAKEGMPMDGPFSADTLFLKALNKENKYDGVLTMYHDQGQIAIKLQDFQHCVTVSAGLPHPITTPAHGTAYDIAGTGKCVTLPFEDAFNLCCCMAKNDLIAKKH